jgi:hypothetical protein
MIVAVAAGVVFVFVIVVVDQTGEKVCAWLYSECGDDYTVVRSAC